jgi:homoserine/homoserine lactone efflux protein
MALDTFLLYLATWTLVAVSPGPAVMFSMSQAARRGMRGAAAGTAGILFGHVLVFGAVAFGLAALLASYSGAVMTIRIVGALYLMYLGAKMLLAKPRGAETAVAAPSPRMHGGLILQGLIVQLTNPKLLLFVLALLPQFISPDRPLLPQLAIMLAVTVVIDGIALLGYALIAARGARALKGSRAVAWLERAFGGALIFFGVKLLISRR